MVMFPSIFRGQNPPPPLGCMSTEYPLCPSLSLVLIHTASSTQHPQARVTLNPHRSAHTEMPAKGRKLLCFGVDVDAVAGW